MNYRTSMIFFLLFSVLFIACNESKVDDKKAVPKIQTETTHVQPILDIAKREDFDLASKKLKQFQYDELNGKDLLALESLMTTNNINGSPSKKNQLTLGSIIVYKTSRKQIGKIEILRHSMNLLVRAITYYPDGSKINQTVDAISIEAGQSYELDRIVKKIGDRDFSWDILPNNVWVFGPKNKAKFYVQTKK